MFPKGSDDILEYYGQLVVEDLVKFLENHGKMNIHGDYEHVSIFHKKIFKSTLKKSIFNLKFFRMSYR